MYKVLITTRMYVTTNAHVCTVVAEFSDIAMAKKAAEVVNANPQPINSVTQHALCLF